jgi:hypothetical protein
MGFSRRSGEGQEERGSWVCTTRLRWSSALRDSTRAWCDGDGGGGGHVGAVTAAEAEAHPLMRLRRFHAAATLCTEDTLTLALCCVAHVLSQAEAQQVRVGASAL